MRKYVLFLLCLLAIVLSGCYRTTTVILPLDTEGASVQNHPTEENREPETTITASTPESIPDTLPETTPVTEPSTKPTSTQPVELPTEPSTEPSIEPTAPPATKVTEPSTEPEKPDVYDISGHSISSLARSVQAELNARRESEGLSPLTMDDTLCALAAIRAYECSQNPSHTRPDGSAWFTVLEDYAYSGWSNRGENLLYASQGYTASQLVDTWMSSTNHRELILSPDFSFIGISFYKSSGLIYFAAIFLG